MAMVTGASQTYGELLHACMCDVFHIWCGRSLGCTIHEMACTKPPWGEYPPEAAMFQIGIGNTVPGLPDTLPPELRDFFNLCLLRYVYIAMMFTKINGLVARLPGQRPTAHELLEHEFILLYAKQTDNNKHRKKS